jgi:O-antigen ligase
MLSMPGLSILSRITGGLALVLALFAVVITGRLRRWHLMHVAAVLFVSWAGCVLLLVNTVEVPAKFWTFVQLFGVIWMTWELATTRERVYGLLLAYVAGAYVAAAATIALYRRHGEALRRFAVGGADPNDAAMLLTLALPIAWYLSIRLRHPVLRWGCRAYLLVGLVALGLTGSRGGMLASLVGLLIVPLTLTRLTPGRRVAGMVLLSISLVVAALNTPDTLIERLASTGTELGDGQISGRGRIWIAGVRAFSQQPLTGYGTANFKRAVRPFGVGQVAHNSFISVLVEQGLVGLVLYLTMIGAVLFSLLALVGLERSFGLVLLGQLLVTMLPLTWEDQKAVWFILAILLGVSRAMVPMMSRSVGNFPAGPRVPLPDRPRPDPRAEPLTVPGRHQRRHFGT